MLVVSVTYVAEEVRVVISREVANDADFKQVIGQLLYGIEVQGCSFTTHDVFEQIQDRIPVEFKQNCTVCNEFVGDGSVVITITRSIKKKK